MKIRVLFGVGLAMLGGISPAHADAYDLSQNWLVTPVLRKEGPGGTYEGRIYQRYVRTGSSAYSIGNIVYYRFPKAALPKDKPFDAADVAEKIRVAMGFQSWNKRTTGKARVFEQHHEGEQRYVRMFMSEDSESVAYSIAVFRTAYLDEMFFDTQLIQRDIAGALGRTAPAWLIKLRTAASFFLIPSAWAEGGPCPPPCTVGDMACYVAQATCNNPHANSAMNQMNTAMNNPQIQAMTNQTALANQNWAASNAEMKRANNILEDFLQPESAFMFAAASGAGAAAGAIAINFVVDGLAFAGRTIYELITHEKEEAKILERFKSAREQYEKQTTAARELEKAIDGMLDLKEITKRMNIPRSQLVQEMGRQRSEAEARKRLTDDRLDSAIRSNNQACVSLLSFESSKLTDFIESVTMLRTRLQDPQSDEALCTGLRQRLDGLRQAEDELQVARAGIYGGRDIWQKKWNEEYEKAEKDFDRGRGLATKVRDEAIDSAKSQRDRSNEGLDKDLRNPYLWKCMRDRAPAIIRDIPFIGLPIRSGYRSDCEKAFHNTDAGRDYWRRRGENDQAYYRVAGYDDKQGKHRKGMAEGQYDTSVGNASRMRGNNLTHSEALIAYRNFFERIEREQVCSGYPEDCSPTHPTNMTACPPAAPGTVATCTSSSTFKPNNPVCLGYQKACDPMDPNNLVASDSLLRNKKWRIDRVCRTP